MQVLVSKKTGKHWLVYDEKAYLLEAQGSEAFQAESGLVGRQLHHAAGGSYPLMASFVRACDHFGVEKYYSWSGVMNVLGDHAYIGPPWKGREVTSLNLDAFEQVSIE